MTRDELEKHWSALLDAHNAQPAPADQLAVYKCRRCGGTFERNAGSPPPKRCPACDCDKWLDPTAKFRKRRIGG